MALLSRNGVRRALQPEKSKVLKALIGSVGGGSCAYTHARTNSSIGLAGVAVVLHARRLGEGVFHVIEAPPRPEPIDRAVKVRDMGERGGLVADWKGGRKESTSKHTWGGENERRRHDACSITKWKGGVNKGRGKKSTQAFLFYFIFIAWACLVLAVF